jgi:hypothetical protein
MKHFRMITILMMITALAGCSSSKKLDSDVSKAVSSFTTHHEIKEKFKHLEERIDFGEAVYRVEVHEAGFSPYETAVQIMDWAGIGNKFTAGGNEVLAASIGQLIPKRISDCISKGKLCTAYRVRVSSELSEEIPEGAFGTIKSMLNLKEIREITSWSFSCIIVFDEDRAVYAQIEEDVAPNTIITIEENSVIKKIGGVLP